MKSSQPDWTKLTLGTALFLGTIVRFAPTLMAGSPINDGGMFLNMIRDLATSGYLLPHTTSYNFAEIPFAYPPLGFYLARLLADLGFRDITLLQFLPAFASSIAIYGIYLLASALTHSRERGALTALLYALTPRAYTWLVMGGGLTRSLGFCFLLFTGWAVYKLFREGSNKWLVVAIIFSTLTVLSHPEAAIHAVSLGVLLWLFYGRTRRTAIQAVWVAIGTLTLSMPWWGTVLAYHGLDPVRSVVNTGMHGTSFFSRLWAALYPNDSILPVLSSLFVVGLMWGIYKRQYLLLIWTALPFLVEPRSALNVVVFPLSILSASMLSDAAVYFQQDRALVEFMKLKNFNRILVVLAIYLFSESYLFGYRLVNNSLTSTEREAMTWVQAHTPVESQFVLWTGNTSPELDAFQEWFPTLAERKSLTTFQGTEWTLGPRFFSNLRELVSLQTCAHADCLQAWVAKRNVAFDYLLVSKKNSSPELISSLGDEFELIYEDEALVLFAP